MKVTEIQTEGRESRSLQAQAVSPSRGASFAAALRQATAASNSEAANRTYRVQRGDTLWGICRGLLTADGSSPNATEVHAAVKQITRDNGLLDPDRIVPGQTLAVSAVTAKPIGVSAQAPVAASAPIRRERHGPIAVLKRVTTRSVEASSSTSARGVKRDFSLMRLVDSVLGIEETPAASASSKDGVARSPWNSILGGPARLTSPFGMRPDPFTNLPEFHQGIDIAAAAGTPVYPLMPGEVEFSGWKGGYGKVIIVKHGSGVQTVYGHHSRNLVAPGDQVTENTPIAEVGSTGRSTGPHLHFEMRRNGRAMDPIHLFTTPLVGKVAKAL